jgi:probable addiction module antidote protein
MVKTRAYEQTLREALAEPADAAEYLNAALEEDDPAAFLLALKDVADIHGGLGEVAEAAELNRENLYRMLSGKGNPRISSLNAVLHALGLRLCITPARRRRSAA